MTLATVQIADDCALFRSALRATLEDTGEFDVVAETVDVPTTLAQVKEAGPDLVLVAAQLPGDGGGIGVCRHVHHDQDLATLSLLVDAIPDQRQLLRALEAGATGYVPGNVGLADLLRDMKAALRGETCVPPSMLGALLRELIERRRRQDRFHQRYALLTHRERETLTLLAEGHGHGEIAAAFVISPKTARTHIQNILTKLEVHSRLEAVTLAIEHGVVSDSRGLR